jgi:energy-coupling factor transport system permease protein
MRLFLFQEQDSFLHRLNPLTKFGVNLPMWIVLSLVTDPVTPLVFITLSVAALWLLGRISPLRQARLLWPFWTLALGMFVTFAFAEQPSRAGYQVIAEFGWLRITDEGLLVGVATSLRVLALFSLSLLFVMTTDPVEFIQSLIQLRHSPISYRFGYGVLAAYRFVPMLATEVEQVRAAHHVRGFAPGWGPAGVWERSRAFAIPLLASAIRRADRVALAMDSRGFGAERERTYFHEQRFTARDALFAMASGVVVVAAFYGLGSLGLLGRLNPFQ